MDRRLRGLRGGWGHDRRAHQPLPAGCGGSGRTDIVGAAVPHPASSPPGPRPATFAGTAGARTFHDLFVGGRCATAWRVTLSIDVFPDGHVEGAGVARLQGDLRCDFHTAQVQSERLTLAITGHRRGAILDLALSVDGREPKGSNDYGGLMGTLARFPGIPLSGVTGSAHALVTVGDGDQGSYGAAYRVEVRCSADC